MNRVRRGIKNGDLYKTIQLICNLKIHLLSFMRILPEDFGSESTIMSGKTPVQSRHI